MDVANSPDTWSRLRSACRGTLTHHVSTQPVREGRQTSRGVSNDERR